jgi:hypothetical protein
MSRDLTAEQQAALAEIAAGRIVFDHMARFDYVRDGVPLDFWEAAPFDELILNGYVRRNDSGQPLEVTR